MWLSSAGTRYQLICAMYTKYALEHSKPSVEQQLELVEDLVRLQHDDVTSAAVKRVRACDHATARMIEEAMDMPAKHPWQRGKHWSGVEMHLSEGFDVLTGRAWEDLCRVNPSLDAALRLCRGYEVQEVA